MIGEREVGRGGWERGTEEGRRGGETDYIFKIHT